ncbi:MAG: hypothetical protein WC023_07950 [Rhodocyclaceae bacterium]
MSVEKHTGTLVLGPALQQRSAALHEYIRVGNAFLKTVKIPYELSSLLRDGQVCTVWVATIKMPTPLFFSATIRIVYAVEVDGKLHKAVDEVARGLRAEKLWLAGGLGVLGLFTILLYVGFLFWIAAVRMLAVDLPLGDMRREPG